MCYQIFFSVFPGPFWSLDRSAETKGRRVFKDGRLVCRLDQNIDKGRRQHQEAVQLQRQRLA